MNKTSRARQFMPFDSLKGYRYILKEIEKNKIKKSDVNTISEEELNYKLCQIRPLTVACITFLKDGIVYRKEGIISKIDEKQKIIVCVKEEIEFKNIINISADYIKEFDE